MGDYRPAFNRTAAIKSALAVLAVFGLVAALIVLSRVIDLRLSTPAVMWLYRLSLGVTIFGAVLMAVLFGLVLYIGISDNANQRVFSELYAPKVGQTSALYAFFLLASVGAIDSLIHGLIPRWNLAAQPEIRLTYALLYLAVVAGYGWETAKLFQGRGLRWAAICLVGGCIAACAALIVLIAFAGFR